MRHQPPLVDRVLKMFLLTEWRPILYALAIFNMGVGVGAVLALNGWIK